MEDEERPKGKEKGLFALSSFLVGDYREGRVSLFLHLIAVLLA